MDAYPHKDHHRMTVPRIEDYILRTTGVRVVYGLDEIVGRGSAAFGSDRVAGFMETHDRREWVLRVDAASPVVWRTRPVPRLDRERVGFVLSVGFGNGSPLPQPSGRWDIYCNDRLACSVRVVKHSQLWQGAEASFAFAANRIESAEPWGALRLSTLIDHESFAAFGPAILSVPAAWVKPGEPAVLRVVPRGEYPSTRWFQLAAAPGILNQSDIYRAADLLTDARVPRVDGYNVYFGDVHTHSGQVCDETANKGCGMGTWVENYEYARGAGGLDFYTLTDHEWQVDPDNVEAYLGLADRYDDPGRFASIPGFEYTSLLYGHRNVYWRASGGAVFDSTKDWGRPTMDPAKACTNEELWHALEQTGVPFITVPHHPSSTSHPCSLHSVRPEYDRLIEVYSVWGSSEYYGDFPRGVSDRYRSLDVRDALRRGWRMGLIASADGHDGHPGNAQSPLVKHHHQFHHCGSGRAAVLAPELTRAAVWDALHDRRCYATTGTPIVLSFTLNGRPMGAELPALPAGARPALRVACTGTNRIDHVRIVKNSRVVETLPVHGEFSCELEWEDCNYDPAGANYYYVRVVQADRESAWSSPVWLG